jgi:hypothetical protein
VTDPDTTLRLCAISESSVTVTMHFNGQSTVHLDGDRATGECYTIARHVFTEGGTRKIMIAWLRYLDVFAKIDGAWYFVERQLILEWSETRVLGTETTPA